LKKFTIVYECYVDDATVEDGWRWETHHFVEGDSARAALAAFWRAQRAQDDYCHHQGPNSAEYGTTVHVYPGHVRPVHTSYY